MVNGPGVVLVTVKLTVAVVEVMVVAVRLRGVGQALGTAGVKA